MEPYNIYTNFTISSSSSSSYDSNNSFNSSVHLQPHEEKNPKPQAGFRSGLHSVRKNIITKKPIAPMPPIPPRIFKVDPVDFMDVVQKLTSTYKFQPTRLQEVAPPPLSLSPPYRAEVVVNPVVEGEEEEEEEENDKKSIESTFGGLSPLGFSLSPSSIAWCSSILMSPGTRSMLEPSIVL